MLYTLGVLFGWGCHCHPHYKVLLGFGSSGKLISNMTAFLKGGGLRTIAILKATIVPPRKTKATHRVWLLFYVASHNITRLKVS